MTYYALRDQMNLESGRWVVGKDYCAAPTCATCHMSATQEMKTTHNINERLDWNHLLQGTNTLAIKEKCGKAFNTDYPQPKPNIKHWHNMKKVCIACHSKTFAENFKTQYQDEVKLFYRKWLKPGKKLFNQARDVVGIIEEIEGKKYALYTHPIDFAWWSICNGDAKNAHVGAAMMSPGSVETGNGGVVSNWYTSFIPAVEDVIDKGKRTLKKQKNKSAELIDAVRKLNETYNKIKKNPAYYGPWEK